MSDRSKLKSRVCVNTYCASSRDPKKTPTSCSFLTVSVFTRHSILAVHPAQAFLLGRRRLFNVLGQTVHVLGAPGQEASLTDDRTPWRLVLEK